VLDLGRNMIGIGKRSDICKYNIPGHTETITNLDIWTLIGGYVNCIKTLVVRLVTRFPKIQGTE